MLVQVPGVDVSERVAAEKGSVLTQREAAILDEREASARGWLAVYAPDRAIIRVHDELPPAVAELDEAQRAFLTALADDREGAPPTSGDEWQATIFAVSARVGLPGGRAFDAIYRAFLGRSNGPRAGWLLASLAPEFVIGRLREAAGAPGTAAGTAPVGGAA
jgi:lysyl-tRNA synthetase class 1